MPKAMRGLLEKALHDAGLTGTLQRQLPRQVWDAVVGAEIAARAQPTVLTAGALHVLVEDHRWRDQLDAMRTELIRRLNAKLGKPVVRELRFGLAHAGALSRRAGGLSGRAGAVAARPGPGGVPHAMRASGLGLAAQGALDGARAIPAELPAHLRCADVLAPELREIFLRAGQAAAGQAERARELRA